MMTNWEKLVSGDELDSIAKQRKLIVKQEKVPAESIALKEHDGWVVVKQYINNSALMEKDKPTGDLFEDEVWTIFYKMGFKIMNADRDFNLSYSNGLTKQIDVVAIDDDVCLLIECKATSGDNVSKSWKTDLEAINGFRTRLFDEIRSKYPGRRCKYIFATKNYVLGDQDINRMNDFQISNFDYDTVQYYSQLVNHLGQAAKYQLLGNVFSKQTISQMDDRVPAIEGKMGGLTYYTFVIEPERLLKVAYVLHRNKANHRMMPTYQRLIKKERLNAIRKYVNEGGYFPNSLIVSIDTENKGVRFEPGQARFDDSPSRIGVLHLPKRYQSVYVIDGQHRLYGYSETEWASKNSIPVVAFVDLPKEDQVKMFMDINQNQKPVPKSLRNTLNIDLLWTSDSPSQRQEALMLSIGQELGENNQSPLYGHIITGEDGITEKRCITLDFIRDALKQSKFFNTYKKKGGEISVLGTFDKNDNDKTFNLLYTFLVKCFKEVKNYCSDEWEKGSNGFLTINNCIYALIKIFDDITNLVLKHNQMNTVDDVAVFYNQCEEWLLGLCDTINKLDNQTINVIKTSKGGSAKKDSWRALQYAFHNYNPAFTNDDLESYIKEHYINNDAESKTLLQQLEKVFKDKFWSEFPNKENWLEQYVPENISDRLVGNAAIQNNRRKKEGISEEVTPWDLVTFSDMFEIVKFGSNWSAFGQKIFSTSVGRLNKMDALSLLKNLNSFSSKLSNGQHITSSQYEEIKRDFNSYVSGENKVVEENNNGTNP